MSSPNPFKLYSDFSRSTCFIKGDKYYYKLCGEWDICSLSATSSSLLIDSTGSTNPYDAKISASIRIKLNKIITALENRKKIVPIEEFEWYLETFSTRLSGLSSQYVNNPQIQDIIWYLQYEISRMQYEIAQSKMGDGVDDFLCKLMGNCSTNTEIPTKTLIGWDSDVHGCYVSAWFKWCAVKNKCLRDWEEKCEKTPITKTYNCTGTLPTYAHLWDNEESTWLNVNKTNTYSAIDTVTQCQYTCDSGYIWNGTSCNKTSQDVNWACWTADKQVFYSTPTFNLCNFWIASSTQASWTASWSWTCKWTGNWTTIGCYAYNGNGYVNLGNGWWLVACNKDIYTHYWFQKYTCSIWWGCAMNWQPVSSVNPSANPKIAWVCIKTGDWINGAEIKK